MDLVREPSVNKLVLLEVSDTLPTCFARIHKTLVMAGLEYEDKINCTFECRYTLV